MWVFILCLILYSIKRPKSYQVALIAYLLVFVIHIYNRMMSNTPLYKGICLFLAIMIFVVFGKADLEKHRKFDLAICVFLQLLSAAELLIMYFWYSSGKLDIQTMDIVMQVCGAGFGIGSGFYACRRWMPFGNPERVVEHILYFIIGVLSCLLIRQLLIICLSKSFWGVLFQTLIIVIYTIVIYPMIYGGLRKIIPHNA